MSSLKKLMAAPQNNNPTTYPPPKMKSTPSPSQWTAFKNLIILHLAVIGIFWLDYHFKPEEEKRATAEKIRAEHDEDSCYLQMMQDEWEEKIKQFENDKLLKGQASCSKIRIDILSRKKVLEVGYGVTPSEIAEAKRYGILPPCAKLPASLTKVQADEWFKTVTFPTYMRCVEEIVGDRPISVEQKLALVSFCHNLGEGNLRKLLRHPDDIIATRMVRYIYAGGKTRLGLMKRRAWEAAWWEAGLQKQSKLLASR